MSTLGEFHSAASSIAKSIHKVSQKLEHLTKREYDCWDYSSGSTRAWMILGKSGGWDKQ